MSRKKKKKKAKAEAERAQKPPKIGSSLKTLLAGVTLDDKPDKPKRTTQPAPRATPRAKPKKASAKPSDALRGDDRIAFHAAVAGVKPLAGQTRNARPIDESCVAPRVERADRPLHDPHAADDAVRLRLAALVGADVRFDVVRDQELIFAVRSGSPIHGAHVLNRRGVAVEASLDLHGLRGAEAERAVNAFIRKEHRRGVRRVRIVHGKGLHSDGGVGVLADVVERALTERVSAIVLAFATAGSDQGGSGALVVELFHL